MIGTWAKWDFEIWPGEIQNRVFCCFWQRGVSATSTRCFLLDQKKFLAKVIGFLNLENTGNYTVIYSTCANFFGIQKSIFSFTFWNRPLKLGSYVLRTLFFGLKLKQLAFIVEILIFEHFQLSKIDQKCHWKISKINTRLWRPKSKFG